MLGDWPNQVAIDAGASSRLEAKMAGMTPAMFTLSGSALDWAWYTRRPC